MRPQPGRATVAAALVHLFTASGVVLALLMVHFAYAGQVRTVLGLYLLAMLIDGTDGLLARRFRVGEVLPQIDGALLDNIVDYITYAFAPMALLWANGYLPGGAAGLVWAAVPALASCYQFTRTDAKTDDHFFLGFPSYWNVVAFYVIVLGLTPAVTATLLAVLSVLVFVPIKYVYPSRTVTLWRTNMVLAALWLVLYAVITWQLPQPSPVLVALSLAYLVYYAAVSLWLTVRTRRLTAAPAA
ncbi:MAG TPA: CDP-diacylglycerol O-phosphatidyltransferase [Intrasporangiaceae bacterium]|nr:CDP-diacylglycerol O-phosphatidyltransferase [Intrasporangiaceae bacterium]